MVFRSLARHHSHQRFLSQPVLTSVGEDLVPAVRFTIYSREILVNIQLRVLLSKGM